MNSSKPTPRNLVAALVGGEVGIWDYWPSFKHMGAVRVDYFSTDTYPDIYLLIYAQYCTLRK